MSQEKQFENNKDQMPNNWQDKLANKLQQFFNKPTYNNYEFTLSSPYESEKTFLANENSSQNEVMANTVVSPESEEKFEAKNIFSSLRSFFRIYKSKI